MTQQEMAPSAVSRAEPLRGLCGGSVQLPGDDAYDMARSPWNLQMRDYPAAVAYPAFPDEVAEVLRAAAAAGLQVAAQGTGHGAPPLEGRLTDAVLLRTSAMTDLEVDAERRTVRAGAGVLWGDLADAAGRHGLAARHPSSPDVGVVGYTLGGGIGWYARKLGLQCNAVTAVELVLADGTFVRATADRDAGAVLGAARGSGTPGRRHRARVRGLPPRHRRRRAPVLGLDRGGARAARPGWRGARTRRRRRRRRSGCSPSRTTRRSPPSCADAGSR